MDDFAAPASTGSLSVPITRFSASAVNGIGGYLITGSSAQPLANAAGWSSSPPAQYTLPGVACHALSLGQNQHRSCLAGVRHSADRDHLPDLAYGYQSCPGLAPGSLRQALAQVCLSGSVSFAPTLSGQTLHLTETLVLSRSVTLDGSALAQALTLSGDSNQDGTGDFRVIEVNSSAAVTLKSLTVANGVGFFGGGISNFGALTVSYSTIRNNQALVGAGIDNSGVLTVSHSTILNNQADYGGGISNTGVLTVSVTGLAGSGRLALGQSSFNANRLPTAADCISRAG